MTAKEKAKELVGKYQELIDPNNNNEHWFLYKQCALIAVDEVIQQLIPIEKAPNNKSAFQYWEEVQQEIEKL